MDFVGPIPSLIVVKDTELYFGKDALNVLRTEPDRVDALRALKLQMEQKTVRLGQTNYETKYLAAELFKNIIKTSGFEKEEDLEGVIGIPIRMPYEARRNIAEAAKLAGFKRTSFVYEPTAALLGATDDLIREELQGYSIVIDWGGGTLDLSLIKYDDDSLEEIHVAGDVNELGGKRMDEVIAQKLVSSLPEKEQYLFRSQPRIMNKLLDDIERIKIDMLDEWDYEAIVDEWLSLFDLDLKLEKELVFKTIDEFTFKAAKEIKENLRRAGIKLEEISAIVFAGGVSSSKYLQESLLTELAWRNIPVSDVYTPQMLTGLGCGYLANKDFIIHLSQDFASLQSNGDTCVILPKGTKADSRRKRNVRFLHTDPVQKEASFIFGLQKKRNQAKHLNEQSSQHFQVIANHFVPLTTPETELDQYISEPIYGLFSASDYLTVDIELEGNDKKFTTLHIDTIPFMIKLQGSDNDANFFK